MITELKADYQIQTHFPRQTIHFVVGGHSSHSEAGRGHYAGHVHDRREFKDAVPIQARNPGRERPVEHDRKSNRERIAETSLERRLREESKEAREMRKRQESLDERYNISMCLF